MSDDRSTGDSDRVQPGLITQRMAAERGRGAGILWIIGGTAWWIFGAVSFQRTAADNWFFWPQVFGCAALGTYLIILGIISLRRRNARVTAFEAEYGPDAGRQ